MKKKPFYLIYRVKLPNICLGPPGKFKNRLHPPPPPDDFWIPACLLIIKSVFKCIDTVYTCMSPVPTLLVFLSVGFFFIIEER